MDGRRDQGVESSWIRKRVATDNTKADRLVVPRLDRVSDQKTCVGAMLTIAAFVLFLMSAISMIRSFLDQPRAIVSEVLWTKQHGPSSPGPTFPVEIACHAPAGCWFSVQFANDDAQSQHCSRAIASTDLVSGGVVPGKCYPMQFDAVRTVAFCQSGVPGDGLYILQNTSSSAVFRPTARRS